MLEPQVLAGSAAGYLIATGAVDVVAVYTQDYRQAFPNARPIKAVIKESAKVMEHPLETGATITDHRIIQPTEIELSLMLTNRTYRDTYLQIKQLFLDAELLVVQTRSGIYSNQLIASLPHEETPDLYNSLAVALSLKEVQFANTRTSSVPYAPKYIKDQSNVARGTQNGSDSSAQNTEKASVLYELFK